MKICARLRFLILVLPVFPLCTHAAPDDEALQQKELKKIIYKDLLEIKQFFWIVVTLQGSAKEIGLDQAALEDYVRLRIRNTFAGFPIVPPSTPEDPKSYNPQETAAVRVTIWTVGTDYPVAYHIELSMGPMSKMDLYETALLGYASAKALKDERLLKDAISDLMDNAGTILFTVQEGKAPIRNSK